MKTIHAELGVGAPAQVAWEVLADLEGWARWNPVMRGEGRFEEGARPLITIANPGAKPVELRPKIIRVEEGREIRWLRRLGVPGLFDSEFGMRIAAEDAGRCRFEQFGIFRGLLANAIVARNAKAFEMAFQAMGRAFKREAERVARARA